MFEKYEIIGRDDEEKVYTVKVIDSTFEEDVFATKNNDGLDVMTPIIFLYSSKNMNVPANIAKAYVHMCNRFKLDPKEFLDRMLFLNKNVAQYKDDIEKYLLLL